MQPIVDVHLNRNCFAEEWYGKLNNREFSLWDITT